MLVIGIVGGVASGKSTVANQLQALGAALLDADRAGHMVLRDPEVLAQVRERWGPSVLGADGHVVRSRLAAIVFAAPPQGPAELAHLERLTHPRIRALLEQQLAAYGAAGHPAAVLDAPVMIKAGWHQRCDEILFVAADEATRRARALGRGWSEAEFRAREAAQESLDEKRRYATAVIDNSRDPQTTWSQVLAFWRQAGLPLPNPSSTEFPIASFQAPD